VAHGKLSISIEVIGRSAGDMIREAMNGLVVSWPNGVGGFRGTATQVRNIIAVFGHFASESIEREEIVVGNGK